MTITADRIEARRTDDMLHLERMFKVGILTGEELDMELATLVNRPDSYFVEAIQDSLAAMEDPADQ